MEGVEETVDQIADRLYALPPQRFVAERAEAVAAARESGDAATGAALRKLRRPTVAAWLVNLLALRRPELLEDLADLAAALHTAQQELDGERLRELTTRRRAAVSALVSAARSLALEVEPTMPAGRLPLGEVETTLTAALTDPQAAAQIRSGRLVRAVAPTGFGELPKARLRLISGAAPAPPQSSRTEPSREQVAAELAQARTGAETANAGLEQATTAEREAKEAVAQLDAEIAELTARRAEAARRVVEAQAAGLEARRAVVAARRRVGEAEAMLAALDAAD